MNENAYPFTLSRTEFRYEFISVSAKKEVRKIVLLSQTEDSDIYNLALLDLFENGELSDTTETNNDDLKTVIATVFQIINDFLLKVPDCFVGFRRSDERRQRLYRIIIARQLPLITKEFTVYGGTGKTIQIFEPNNYYNFYLIRKL